MTQTTTPQQDRRSLTALFVGAPPIDLQAACDADCTRSVDIDIVTDGREAIRRLTDASSSATDSERPDLILLEFGFRLPDGTTLLRAIRSSPRLRTVPVVVLTTEERDAETVYTHGGNAHVTIPETPETYGDLIGSIEQFWFQWVQYPAESLYSDR